MGVHPTGTGTEWDAVEKVTSDQPHGSAYLTGNHIALGVNKRMGQEHVTFADDTVGGIHKPGGAAVLGICDGTPGAADGTYRGHGIVWDNTARLWCSTAIAGASTSGDFTLILLHPDKQWKGGDITWTGAAEFDQSVDISGPLDVWGPAEFFAVDISGGLDCTGALACGSTVAILGTLTCSSSAYFTNDVSCKADLVVDGTAVFTTNVDISGTLDVSGAATISGDVSCSQAASAWAVADWTTNTIHGSYNVANVDWSTDGVACISFTANLASANYCAVATLSDNSNPVVKNTLRCISRSTSGIRLLQHDGANSLSDDISVFSIMVLI